MADRASVNEIAQVGVEVTAGTAVATTRRLGALSITPTTELDVKVYKPKGKKFGTVASVNKEWTTAKVDGQATYNEAVYPYLSIIKKVAPTTPVGATNARLYTLSPASSGADIPQTYTVETGSSGAGNAQKFDYGLFVEFGQEWSRKNGVSVSGAMIGRRTTYGATLSGGASELDLIPIEPTDINVYTASSHAGLDAASALDRALAASWKLGSRFGPIWTLKRSNDSWAAHIELDPTGEVTFMVGADSAGLAYLNTLREGDTLFMRVEAIGPEIESGFNHEFVIDMALKLTKISPLSDDEGLVAVTYTGELAHDPTWGKATEITIQTDLASL